MIDPNTDAAMLAEFRRSRNGEAFNELVSRYLGMVFGVAWRKTGDRGMAEEIAQNTFIALAKKADSLPDDVVLGGWLHRVATIEAAEFNRREYRRRTIMTQLKEASNADNNAPETKLFEEFLPDLDDAMSRLSTQDRDAILLRFHAGMRFKEMAERLGKSEDAARKQVNRAVEKLATLLGGKRGTTVSVGVVIAGLPIALTKTAPDAMVTSIAAKAIAAAPAITTGSSLTLNFLCIMKTQAGIVAAIGILLVASSFFAGRRTAASFGNNLLEQTERNAVQRQAYTEKQRETERKKAGSDRRSVKQILDDAASILRDESSSTAAYYEALLVLQELDPTDYEDAIAHLEMRRDGGKTFEQVGSMLTGLWATVDGAAAIAWAEQNLNERRGVAFQNVLESWSINDPEAAYAWYLDKAEAGDSGMGLSSFRWLSKRVFSGWAEKDPKGAVAALQTVAVEDERGAVLGVAGAVQSALNPEPILRAVAAMDESRIRTKLIAEVAGEWAEEEPHSAAAWLDSVPMASAKARLAAKGEVAEEWLEYSPGDIIEIGAWFIASAPDEMRDQLIEQMGGEIERRQRRGE